MTRRTETRAVSPPRESVQRETQRVDTALSLTLSADGLEKKREELDYEFHSSRLFFFSFFFFFPLVFLSLVAVMVAEATVILLQSSSN